MRVINEEAHQAKKIDIMQHCYECYAEHGLTGVGIKTLAQACGLSSGSLYTYFPDLDDLIVQSTAYCMSRIEDDFMRVAPRDFADLERFLTEVPYWTAETHGKQYRLMYQIYTHPKYREHGKEFFEGVNRRYAEYAAEVAVKIGLPADKVRPIIFTFVRACVHYALYEDEFYLQEQLRLLRDCLALFAREYHTGMIT